VILDHGMRRMMEQHADEFYYVTVMNENYAQPSLPDGAEGDVIRGLYPLRKTSPPSPRAHVRLLGSGAILREVAAAAELLASEWDIGSDVFSATSFSELARDARATERWNRLHPTEPPRRSHVDGMLAGGAPIVAATDYVRAYPQLIAAYTRARFVALGTDGFGRSDTRAALRGFFEVDRRHVVVAALHALAQDGLVPAALAADAIARYAVDVDATPSWDA